MNTPTDSADLQYKFSPDVLTLTISLKLVGENADTKLKCICYISLNLNKVPKF